MHTMHTIHKYIQCIQYMQYIPYIHTYIHTYVHTYIQTYVHTYHAYIHTHTCIHTYTHNTHNSACIPMLRRRLLICRAPGSISRRLFRQLHCSEHNRLCCYMVHLRCFRTGTRIFCHMDEWSHPPSESLSRPQRRAGPCLYMTLISSSAVCYTISYVCMYVCMHVCMYVCTYVRLHKYL
jgi:hypothetical protein